LSAQCVTLNELPWLIGSVCWGLADSRVSFTNTELVVELVLSTEWGWRRWGLGLDYESNS